MYWKARYILVHAVAVHHVLPNHLPRIEEAATRQERRRLGCEDREVLRQSLNLPLFAQLANPIPALLLRKHDIPPTLNTHRLGVHIPRKDHFPLLAVIANLGFYTERKDEYALLHILHVWTPLFFPRKHPQLVQRFRIVSFYS